MFSAVNMFAPFLLLALSAEIDRAFAGTIPSRNYTLQHQDRSSTNGAAIITAYNFTQRLDHFDISNQDTFQQLYYVREEFWKANGPIFVYISGEGRLSRNQLNRDLVYQLGTETNGVLYALEHRYYGESTPHDWVQKLNYLSSRQALADLAEFIKHLKGDIKYGNSKVVVIGGSYAGSLAAWMRAKYPDLVDAALASSAPLLAKVGFQDIYSSTIKDVYKKYGGDECYKHIEIFKKKLIIFFWTGHIPDTVTKLMSEYKCENEDVISSDSFVARITQVFIQAVQFGHPQTIRDYCNAVAQVENESILNSLDNVVKLIENNHVSNYCEMLKASKIWYYQECTEFGYLASEYLCNTLFYGRIKTSVEEAVSRTNEYYGGLQVNVSRVVFTHGNMDPWARLGRTQEQSSPQAPVIVINDTSHCKDIANAKVNDTEELINSRDIIKGWIKRWLQS